MSYRMELSLFGVTAEQVRDTLDKSGLCEGLSVSVTGTHMLVSAVLSSESEDGETRCRNAAVFLKGTYGSALFSENGGTLWETAVSSFREKKETLALAESCTGGLISKAITDVPGASDVFPFGAVTYSPDSKKQILGVREDTLQTYGVVSKETAAEMAEGVRLLSKTTVGLAVTGFAGSGGGDQRFPQGTVFVALSDGINVYVRHLSLTHSGRSDVRLSAMLHGLDMLRLYSGRHLSDIGDVLPVPVLSETTPEPVKENKVKLPWYKRFVRFFTDFPKDSLKEKFRKIFLVLAIGVMLFAAGKLAVAGFELLSNTITNYRLNHLWNQGNNLTEQERQEILDKLQDAGVEVPENVQNWALPFLLTNPDTVGRVYIKTPDDPNYLNEIVVQGENNDEYLRKNFYGDQSTLGTVFMDCRNDPQAGSVNTILHGHSTRNVNKVFNKLHKYKTLDFLNQNPIVYLDTLTETRTYKIFAITVINTVPSGGEVYTGSFYTGAAVYSELEDIRDRSLFDTTVDVVNGDRLLTLSTCTFEADGLRLVIMAREVREGESLTVEPASVNTDVLQYDRNNPDPTPIPLPTPSDDPSSDSSSSTPSSPRFEIYDMSLACNVSTAEKTSSIKAYVPFYSDYDDECVIGMGQKPAHGRVSLVSSDGTVNYYPNKSFTGVDTFTVVLTDSSNLRRDTATVTVYVGVEQETGLTLNAGTLFLTAKAGKSGTAQIKANSVTGQTLTYEVLPNEGLFSGSARVSSTGLVTYTSAADKRYADTVKVLIRDEDGVARLAFVKVNNDRPFADNQNPVISELIPPSPPVASSSDVSSDDPSSLESGDVSDVSSGSTATEDTSSEDTSAEAPSDPSSQEEESSVS